MVPACRPTTPIPVHEGTQYQLEPQAVPHNRTRQQSEFASLPRQPGETILVGSMKAVAVERKESLDTIAKLPTLPPLPREETEPIKTDSPSTVSVPNLAVPLAQEPVVRAFDLFLKGKTDEAMAALKSMEPRKQEVMLSLIPALAQLAQADASQFDQEEGLVLARQLESVAAQLARRARLSMKTVLCTNIDGYGDYTPVRSTQQLIHSAPYLLYVEVGNVPCVPHTRQDGVEGYQTRLECSMQVKDEAGRPLEIVDVFAPGNKPTTVLTSSRSEFSRSPVHDYFIRAQFDTPSRPGLYTVTYEITDPLSNTSKSKTITFRVQ
jgi:hypothetical protein